MTELQNLILDELSKSELPHVQSLILSGYVPIRAAPTAIFMRKPGTGGDIKVLLVKRAYDIGRFSWVDIEVIEVIENYTTLLRNKDNIRKLAQDIAMNGVMGN